MIPYFIKEIASIDPKQIDEDRLYIVKGTVDGDLARVNALLDGVVAIETIDLDPHAPRRERERCIHFLRFGPLYGGRIRALVSRQLLLVDFGSRFIVGPDANRAAYATAAKSLEERLHRRYTIERIKLGDKRGIWSPQDAPGEYLLIECTG